MRRTIWKATPFLLIILFRFPHQPLLAQNESLDSLNKALYLTLDNRSHVRILNQISLELRQSDPGKSWEYMEEALALAIKLNHKAEIAATLSLKGSLLESRNNYSSALQSFIESLNLNSELGKTSEVAYLHFRVANLYKTLGNYEKALEHCYSGLRIYEKNDDTRGVANIYRVMGSIYKYKMEYDKSLYYYFNGLELNEKSGYLQGAANSYNNIGIVYLLNGDHDKALDFYKKSLGMNRALDNDSEIAINLGNIGTVYLEMNELDSAWLYFNKLYEAALALNNMRRIASSFQAFGDYYLKKKEYGMASDYYQKSYQLARELGILETSKNLLLSLSQLSEEVLDHIQALVYFKSYINLRDSLLNRETLQRLEHLEIEYAYEKERSEHLLQEEKDRLFMLLVFGVLFLSSLFLLLIFMSQRIKLKRKNLYQKKLEFEKQQLQYNVDLKDKEMFSKAISLAEKTEFLNDISRRLKKVATNPSDETRTIKRIIKDLEFNASTKIWDEFEYSFLNIHPGFFDSLESRYSNLTPNEKRLCAFLRLNLSTKDIANITRQSNHSLTVARTRLRKKLGLANTGESLSSFLTKF
jgi:tetratricopeptide (TPR) repeat protein/DNA-binding CsgD family transcriptional regulator